MVEPTSAWGIEIGQAGLKAMRLRVEEGADTLRAVAFDFVPHPKILSQPDAIPEELIAAAVTTFLSRNRVDNDLIAISVPGHTSLAKFIKLPPVEPSKVAEIVKYEARQQIPFDLDDVIWDYQPIGGGVEESGFMLEAEVGLFAMKREQVYEAMRPLTDQGKEVELVQIAPLGLYNYLSYDVLGFRVSADQPDPPDSSDYYIMLDMGADNTTLLVSNGRNIWIRNVPIGGNHFTRALTREMKLTFAKAEHLKCNATKSPDPKAVFQAMRPVFNDYVTEIQRSIGYFGSVNRAAKIKKVIGVGNGFKLAGLQKFLQQNLQYEVERLEELRGVTGDGVLSDPLFMDNMMTFAVPYGLALQTLKKTRIRTTLLPPEIVVDRTIRRKKPWAVAAAAGLMMAMGIATIGSARVLNSVSEGKFATGHKAVKDLEAAVSSNKSAYEAERGAHEQILQNIEQLAAPLKRRELWMELYKAVNLCLPQDEGNDLDQSDPELQKQIRVTDFVSKRVDDVSEWHTALVDSTLKEDFLDPQDAETAPSGSGYVFTVIGYHFYNHKSLDYTEISREFVEKTLARNLKNWTIDGFPVGKLGISHPIVVQAIDSKYIYDPNARAGATSAIGGMGGMGGMAGAMGEGYEDDGDMGLELGMGMGMGMAMGEGYEEGSYEEGLGRGGGVLASPNDVLDSIEEDQEEKRQIKRTDFILQFVWIPTPVDQRTDQPPSVSESTDNGE